jgi:hypothetical protein
MLHQVLRQTLIINRHRIAICRANRRWGNSDLAESVARLVPLLGQTRNDAHGSVMLVERRRKFLPSTRQLFPRVVCLEHQGVPFILESLEQRGERREVWWARADDAARLDGEEVFGIEFVVGAGLFAVLFNVFEDQALLVNGA